MTPEQQLHIGGFNLEGDVVEWFHMMKRNKLISSWDGFLKNVRNRFVPSKCEDPQGRCLSSYKLGQRPNIRFLSLTAEEGDDPGREIPAALAYYLEDKVISEGYRNVPIEDKGEDKPRGSRLPWHGTRIL
ncbi:hypothetical protein Tco_0185740 [Tanacetum coccineum]